MCFLNIVLVWSTNIALPPVIPSEQMESSGSTCQDAAGEVWRLGCVLSQ
jgi:hypothetical protein